METENVQTKRKASAIFGIALLVFAAGVLTGYLLKNFHPRNQTSDSPDHEIRQDGYTFISPLLDCENGSIPEGRLIYPFRNELSNIISEARKTGILTDAAIYFRDLNNGPWHGINERVQFQPASFLKVPVAMAMYKAAEKNPDLLKKKIKFLTRLDRIDGRTPTILPSRKIELGREYTIEELIEAMLIYSDNQALMLVHNNTPQEELDDLYAVLGVESDVLTNVTGTMSVKSFATFYRILFNASYLSRTSSEKILRTLNRTEYKKALVAGVPANIRVAHKFGEGGMIGGIRQLQDCGIVYYPGNPYLLCVMTKGNNIEALEVFIKKVSALVYNRINTDISGKPKK